MKIKKTILFLEQNKRNYKENYITNFNVGLNELISYRKKEQSKPYSNIKNSKISININVPKKNQKSTNLKKKSLLKITMNGKQKMSLCSYKFN